MDAPRSSCGLSLSPKRSSLARTAAQNSALVNTSPLPDEHRPLPADASSAGNLSVLASVTGPAEVRIRNELVDRAAFEINVLPLRSVAGPPSLSLPRAISNLQ